MTLNRDERLKSKRLIASLFQKGSFLVSGAVQIKYVVSEEEQAYPAKAAFTVSKSKFKRAVDRNLLKRRMREAYRLSKADTYTSLEQAGLSIQIIFIYGKKVILPSAEIHSSIKKGLLKVISELLKD